MKLILNQKSYIFLNPDSDLLIIMSLRTKIETKLQGALKERNKLEISTIFGNIFGAYNAREHIDANPFAHEQVESIIAS